MSIPIRRDLTVYDAYPGPVIWIDPSGESCQANRAWIAYTGRQNETGVDCLWAETVHQDDLPQLKSVLVAAGRRPRPFTCEVRLRKSDGCFRSFAVLGTPDYNPQRELEGFLCIFQIKDSLLNPASDAQNEEDTFHRLMEAAPIAILQVSSKGKIIFVNPAAENVLGISNEVVKDLDFNDPIWQACDLDGNPLPYDDYPIIQVIKTKKPSQNIPFQINTPRGARRILSVNATPIINQQGELESIVAVFEDITIRIQAQQRLIESEEKYRSLFEKLRDGFALHEILVDETGKAIDYRFLEVNPAFEKIIGFSAGEVCGKTVRQILPQIESFWIETYGKVALTGEPARFEDYTATLDRYFDILAYSPKPHMFATLAVDITERKKIEAKFHEEHEKIVNILDAMTDGVYIIDAHYIIQYVNPIVLHEFGDIRGRLCYEFFNGSEKPCPWCKHGQVFTGGSVSWEWMHTLSGKTYEVHAAPLRSLTTEPDVLVIFHDITEHRRLEKALQDERSNLTKKVEERTAELSHANLALTRAARLKDEFLASMSHELRTPLTGILGLTEALRQRVYGELSPKQDASLEGIEESGRHLLALINDILDLSKIEAGKDETQLSPIRVGDICQASLRIIKQDAMKRNIKVSFEQDLNVSLIVADARRLKQILVNILSNAVKFTPKNGSIGLTVEGDKQRKTVNFTVWDTGIGMSEEDIAQLFQPFVQIDRRLAREYNGTGLGLALVQRMVNRQGGDVQVESEPGKGSRFTVSLPWIEVTHPALFSDGNKLVVSTLFKKALIVEESDVFIEQMERYVAELGLCSITHNKGQGVVEKAVSQHPDLILLEVLLPDRSGWDVLRDLKADERTRQIPVIVVSIVDERAKANSLGALGYLLKPVSLADLQSVMIEAGTRWKTEYSSQPTSEQGSLQDLAPLILLVDDNKMTVDMLADYLKTKSYRVIVAGNGHQALQLALEKNPSLIIMDVQMPGMDGLEAIRRIRADQCLKKTPVIALTALVMPGDQERCLAAGADEYLGKPVSLKHLVEMLERHLNRL